jgi:HEPN domain-containing protein
MERRAKLCYIPTEAHYSRKAIRTDSSDMKQTTLNWLRGAEYDFQTAQSLFKARRYIYVIFMCHLSVEKLLKAIIAESTPSPPPRTHNLYRLLELSHIDVPETHKDIVAKLNSMSVATRYPEDIAALVTEMTRKICREYLTQTEEFLQWLRQNPRLRI